MKVETKVGFLFLFACALTVIFAYVLGLFNPFSNYYDINVLYNFAGGIEVGSPVRVMGIKVGKVKEIRFSPQSHDSEGKEVKLQIIVGLDKKVRDTVRSDSRFFINLAGIIGEKFVEITPGSLDQPSLEDGATVRGEDPPRIDQLISQSYGLAGEILEFFKKNEGKASDTLHMMNDLVTNLNKTLVLLDHSTKNVEVNRLLKNFVKISDDVSHLTGKLSTKDADKTYELMHRLIWRLEGVDKDTVRKFLQEEGIRAKIF